MNNQEASWARILFVLLLLGAGSLLNKGLASSFKYINYHFENGSPVFWEIQEDGSVLISLMYDHERNSQNRAAGHWNFQVFADKGSRIRLELQNLNNIWNNMASSPAKDATISFLSVDGKSWTAMETTKTPDNHIQIDFVMPEDSVYVARLEPYRVSDLNKLMAEIEAHPLIDIQEIGQTVESRPLEIIRVGHENAPNHIFLRGRAHAWEPGGNWVIQGLIQNLLRDDPEVNKYLELYCIYILPMANKDGVAHGATRFNFRGMDLNRKWDKTPDPYLSPENAAFENWLTKQIELGLKPDLAIDFHNDDGGKLHYARPNISLDRYLSNMARFESLLRKHTWFTEGGTGSNFRNPGSLGEGLLERFGIEALIYELNANWIAGLNKMPSGNDWMLLGEQLGEVFYLYFSEQEKE